MTPGRDAVRAALETAARRLDDAADLMADNEDARVAHAMADEARAVLTATPPAPAAEPPMDQVVCTHCGYVAAIQCHHRPAAEPEADLGDVLDRIWPARPAVGEDPR